MEDELSRRRRNSSGPKGMCVAIIAVLFPDADPCASYYSHVVNRVHWIRARSQKHRWQEEFIITGYEMQWTVRYYLHQAKVWSDRGIVSEYHGNAGATAYAHRKIAMWTGMAKAADIRFKQVNRAYEGLTTV